MTREQMKTATSEVLELIKDSDWEFDDNDAMDGYVYITICRPQTQIEKEIIEYIRQICSDNVLERDRTVLNGKELDIYIPNKKIVGISKIARLLDVYAKRLQTQEL